MAVRTHPQTCLERRQAGARKTPLLDWRGLHRLLHNAKMRNAAALAGFGAERAAKTAAGAGFGARARNRYAQFVGMALWTGCTRLKTNQIEAHDFC